MKFTRSLGSKVFIEYSSEEGLLSVRPSVWAEAGKKNTFAFSQMVSPPVKDLPEHLTASCSQFYK